MASSFKFFNKNRILFSNLSHACCMFCLSHPLSTVQPNNFLKDLIISSLCSFFHSLLNDLISRRTKCYACFVLCGQHFRLHSVNDMMISAWYIAGDLEGSGKDLIEILFRHSHGQTKKITITIIQNRQCASRDSIQYFCHKVWSIVAMKFNRSLFINSWDETWRGTQGQYDIFIMFLR